MLRQVRTSDRGDELLQSPQQLSVSLKVVEVMLHPVTAHIQHSVITSLHHCYIINQINSTQLTEIMFPHCLSDWNQTLKK